MRELGESEYELNVNHLVEVCLLVTLVSTNVRDLNRLNNRLPLFQLVSHRSKIS